MDFVITIGLRKGVNKILFQHRDTSTFLGLSCARVLRTVFSVTNRPVIELRCMVRLALPLFFAAMSYLDYQNC